MLEYEISATVIPHGDAKATANQYELRFDATSGRDEVLPNRVGEV